LARKELPDLHLICSGLHHQSKDVPLPSGAEIRARVADEELKNIYSACDAWLFGPRKEGFGLPILEAMACRTPVIATPAGAAPELLAGGGGILVPHENPQAMADAIIKVCSMADHDWRRLSDAAYATVTGF